VRYRLKNKDARVDIEIEPGGEERFTAAVGGKKIDVLFRRISRHQILLTVAGRQTRAYVSDSPDGKSVVVRGRSWLLQDGRAPRARASSARRDAPRSVTPPMPAVVTRILVNRGDRVKKGQAVVVVSAMKMDTTLTAPYDGRVTRINAAEGDKVSPGQILVEVAAGGEKTAA
jgi:3-methylcrotonyl-CoA carboxylase alpha subunit